MERYHKQDVAPIEKENERDENYEASNPQIDSERTRNNYRFTPYFGKTYTEFINGRIKELGLSPRKDAVVMNSFVLGSDKTFFDGLAKIEQYNFFSGCYKFFTERYGSCGLSKSCLLQSRPSFVTGIRFKCICGVLSSLCTTAAIMFSSAFFSSL